MAKRLTDKQRKEIIADYVELGSYRAVAKKHGVTHQTVKRVAEECTQITQKIQHKKEQNTADILAHMDSKKDDVNRVIDRIDYGTMNPFSAGLWCVLGGKAVRIKEYYYNGRESSVQKTDEDYCDAVAELAKDYTIKRVVVDPSAAFPYSRKEARPWQETASKDRSRTSRSSSQTSTPSRSQERRRSATPSRTSRPEPRAGSPARS